MRTGPTGSPGRSAAASPMARNLARRVMSVLRKDAGRALPNRPCPCYIPAAALLALPNFRIIAGWSSPVARQAHNRREGLRRAQRDERSNDAPAQAGAQMHGLTRGGAAR